MAARMTLREKGTSRKRGRCIHPSHGRSRAIVKRGAFASPSWRRWRLILRGARARWDVAFALARVAAPHSLPRRLGARQTPAARRDPACARRHEPTIPRSATTPSPLLAHPPVAPTAYCTSPPPAITKRRWRRRAALCISRACARVRQASNLRSAGTSAPFSSVRAARARTSAGATHEQPCVADRTRRRWPAGAALDVANLSLSPLNHVRRCGPSRSLIGPPSDRTRRQRSMQRLVAFSPEGPTVCSRRARERWRARLVSIRMAARAAFGLQRRSQCHVYVEFIRAPFCSLFTSPARARTERASITPAFSRQVLPCAT